MSLDKSANLPEVSECIHGGLPFAELRARGIDPATVLDFSTNVNPLGPSPRVREALLGIPLAQYPDRHCTELRETLAGHLGVGPDNILCANGSSELLHLIAQSWLNPADKVLILGPTYSEYARAARLRTSSVQTVCATTAADIQFDPATIEQTLVRDRFRLCFLCTPNNPTGQLIPASWVERWAERCPQTQFVVDEAYVDFVPQAQSLAACGRPNILVLRSLTKAYGLAALRLGYAVAPPQRLADLIRVRPPWNVNAFAQTAGVAALNDPMHLQQSLEVLNRGKQQLLTAFQQLGLRCLETSTPFFLMKFPDSKSVVAQLWQRRILVRDCTSFGLMDFIRICPRLPEENAQLVRHLSESIHGSSDFALQHGPPRP